MFNPKNIIIVGTLALILIGFKYMYENKEQPQKTESSSSLWTIEQLASSISYRTNQTVSNLPKKTSNEKNSNSILVAQKAFFDDKKNILDMQDVKYAFSSKDNQGQISAKTATSNNKDSKIVFNKQVEVQIIGNKENSKTKRNPAILTSENLSLNNNNLRSNSNFTFTVANSKITGNVLNYDFNTNKITIIDNVKAIVEKQ